MRHIQSNLTDQFPFYMFKLCSVVCVQGLSAFQHSFEKYVFFFLFNTEQKTVYPPSIDITCSGSHKNNIFPQTPSGTVVQGGVIGSPATLTHRRHSTYMITYAVVRDCLVRSYGIINSSSWNGYFNPISLHRSMIICELVGLELLKIYNLLT